MLSEQSISHRLERLLDEPVIDRSVVGARVIMPLPLSGALGMNISKQYRPGNWDWIILNGGGNDLWLGCGCVRCDGKLNRLISRDGQQGEIAQLVTELRATGARVIYVGYLRSPGRGSPIEHCRDEGDALEERIAQLSDTRDGVFFLSLQRLVPEGDLSFHAPDRIHPSLKASRVIAAKIKAIMDQNP